MKKILVTGGLGFIGFHLIKFLFDFYENSQITVIDNLSSTKINFKELYSKLNVYINDLKMIENLSYEFEYIYHLASPVGSLGILSMNGFVAKEIIDLTYKAIDIAEKSKAKLLFVSSSEVYGHSGNHDENTTLHIKSRIGTRGEYALGKLISEIILHNLSLSKNLIFNICRPFNVIGEHQSSRIGFVVPTFFESALRNNDITVFYTGLQKRSFCHVQDIVKALVKIQESSCNKEIFNIGNDNNVVTIIDLAKKIKSICNSKSNIVHLDPIKLYGESYIEAFDKIPNIVKIKTMLDWKPEIDIDTALNKIYKYYQSNYESIICKSCI